MRDRVRLLPVWALLLLTGVPAAAYGFVVGLVTGADPLWNLGFAVLIGLALAVALTFSLRTRWRLQDEAIGQVSADFRRSVSRAAWTGPIPADPEIRVAAVQLAERHLQHARRVRPWMYVAVAGLAISIIGNAILDPWKLLFSIFYLPLPVLIFIGPKRLRSRIALLSAPQ